jgi:hypothetical protein
MKKAHKLLHNKKAHKLLDLGERSFHADQVTIWKNI